MTKKRIVQLSALGIVLLAVILMAILLPADNLTTCEDCGGEKYCAACHGIEAFICEACGGDGVAIGEDGAPVPCEACGEAGSVSCATCEGTRICATCEGTGSVKANSMYYATFMALVPPIVAIGLALITKEVYSSLFIGIVLGGIFAANFSFSGAVDAVVSDGLISAVSDTAGIFVFLVVLGILVALLNRAGGAQAFGKWAETHVRTKLGAILATFVLGVLIFIDDYFNCLTVGAVMRPVTDKHKISRVKLAYIIDATAAPVCMIAPISSWAAAVATSVPEDIAASQGSMRLFINAIPFNFYSLLTIVFVITMAVIGYDYGKMAKFEKKAQEGDLLSDGGEVAAKEQPVTTRARVFDLVVPIAVLIIFSILGLLYNGGLFSGVGFVETFENTDATVGLPWGSILALIVTIVYLIARRLISFEEAMKCIPQGFIAMVPAILILTFATSLKNVTGLLGADVFVGELMNGAAESLVAVLPAIIFLVACILSFSTGTSWGTFGILIPIVVAVFPDPSQSIFYVGISACLAGAVCGDHCSPISDTTIMASAGAQCNHVDHVSTQLLYAITVAAVSFVMFLFAGFVPNAWIALPVGIVLMIATVFGIRYFEKWRASKATSKAE